MVIIKKLEKKDTVVDVLVPDKENGGTKIVEGGGLRSLYLNPITTLQPMKDGSNDLMYPFELEKLTTSIDSKSAKDDLIESLFAPITAHSSTGSRNVIWVLWLTYTEYLEASHDLDSFYEKYLTREGRAKLDNGKEVSE